MKIEGLGDTQMWNRMENGRYTGRGYEDSKLTIDTLKVGQEIAKSTEPSWIITDVLGDGKFKAVQKNDLENLRTKQNETADELINKLKKMFPDNYGSVMETFDISGKIDTNNPIYKFYENEMQKYLKRFGAQRVTDDKGVTWFEVPIKEEYGKRPVQAFQTSPDIKIGK